MIEKNSSPAEDMEANANYINASYIDGPLEEDNKLFIATQAPIKSTMENFWNLIFDKKISLLIMLCNLIEDGRVKNLFKKKFNLIKLNKTKNYKIFMFKQFFKLIIFIRLKVNAIGQKTQQQ